MLAVVVPIAREVVVAEFTPLKCVNGSEPDPVASSLSHKAEEPVIEVQKEAQLLAVTPPKVKVVVEAWLNDE